MTRGADRPTLVGLAAGLGTRFGGPKQLEPLGPRGETILDYAIHDAWRAGFGAVVLVARAELRAAFERGVAARWRDRIPVAVAEQRAGDAGGAPPGTAHAVLAAAGALGGARTFAVINGDDFYGREAYGVLAEFLRGAPDDDATYAAVGFPLRETLSEAGGVNRAVIAAAPDGLLAGLEEVTGIVPAAAPDAPGDGVAPGPGGAPRRIPGDTLVSMNMWGFTRAVLPQLADGWRAFAAGGAAGGAEFQLPREVESLVRAGRARVRVLRGGGPWCGVTHPDDRARVAGRLAALAARGEYPSPVWA